MSNVGGFDTREYAMLALTVVNHPGVMSHICGLFARRAYNVEGIVCLPTANRERSRIWLWIPREQRLDQIVAQLSKLQDVIAVEKDAADPGFFRGFAGEDPGAGR